MKPQAAHSGDAAPPWPAQLTVTSSRVADVLTDLYEAAFLRPFFTPDGVTVGEVARRFRLAPNAAYRRVKRLETLGVLETARQERRRGKPLRHYRTRARQFFIPDTVFPPEDFICAGLQAQLDEFHDQLAQAVRSGPNPVRGLVCGELDLHLRVAFATADGQVWDPRAPGTPVTKWAFRTLHLDHDRAQALIADLRAVAARYYDDQGSTLYLLGQFLTPVTGAGSRDEDLALHVE